MQCRLLCEGLERCGGILATAVDGKRDPQVNPWSSHLLVSGRMIQ